jgi:hypothetical protein
LPQENLGANIRYCYSLIGIAGTFAFADGHLEFHGKEAITMSNLASIKATTAAMATATQIHFFVTTL